MENRLPVCACTKVGAENKPGLLCFNPIQKTGIFMLAEKNAAMHIERLFILLLLKKKKSKMNYRSGKKTLK